jgi:transcriptional regulator with XRE-family HTH domain
MSNPDKVLSWAEKIKKLLESHHYSLADMAKIAGVSTATVHGWVSKDARPFTESLLLIARHFDVSLEYLVDDFQLVETRKIAESEDTQILNVVHRLGHQEAWNRLLNVDAANATPVPIDGSKTAADEFELTPPTKKGRKSL